MNIEKIESLIAELLIEIGEDPTRPGLQDTPRRVASMWQEFVAFDPGKIETCFETANTDQMVVVRGMRVWSMCEHHLLPFYCDISIAYIAQNKVLGLSKFGRIAHLYAHRLQIQEQLVEQIANEVMRATDSQDVAVIGKGEHLCMTMRGVKTPAIMVSSSLHGRFRTEKETRAEFLQLVSC